MSLLYLYALYCCDVKSHRSEADTDCAFNFRKCIIVRMMRKVNFPKVRLEQVQGKQDHGLIIAVKLKLGKCKFVKSVFNIVTLNHGTYPVLANLGVRLLTVLDAGALSKEPKIFLFPRYDTFLPKTVLTCWRPSLKHWKKLSARYDS